MAGPQRDEPATTDIEARCRAFVGRERIVSDTMAPEPAAGLATILGQAIPGDVLPPTWHWVYFQSPVPEADRGEDLHEKLGLFLPPAPFPRRMWAASDLTVLEPLALGAAAERRSVIEAVDFKTGRSGPMCFVTVHHAVSQAGRPRIEERQTIVYRERGTPEPALRTADEPVPEGHFVHSDGRLFFYSAVTMNGHRIHWDRDFCRRVEGYPDLIVHGPLMATELFAAMGGRAAPCRFAFRAQAPVYDTTPVRFDIGGRGRQREARIQRADGVVAMTATLEPPAP